MRLKLNIWTAIDDIVNIIFAALSWFLIFGAAFSDAGGNNADSMADFLMIVAAIGIILNLAALIQSHRHNISTVGPILGLIGNILFFLGSIMAFPALVILIVACVFSFMQHPAKK